MGFMSWALAEDDIVNADDPDAKTVLGRVVKHPINGEHVEVVVTLQEVGLLDNIVCPETQDLPNPYLEDSKQGPRCTARSHEGLGSATPTNIFAIRSIPRPPSASWNVATTTWISALPPASTSSWDAAILSHPTPSCASSSRTNTKQQQAQPLSAKGTACSRRPANTTKCN